MLDALEVSLVDTPNNPDLVVESAVCAVACTTDAFCDSQHENTETASLVKFIVVFLQFSIVMSLLISW